MDNNIVFLAYVIGIASCAAQGAERGKYQQRFPVVLYSVVSAFGGGLIRDAILNVHPWILSPLALPDLVFVIIIGFLYSSFLNCKMGDKYYAFVKKFVVITDAFGLGSFICIGIDKAFDYNNVITIIACGYVTAIGGGIVTSGEMLIKYFNNKKNIHYHLVALFGCFHYYIFRHSLFTICCVAFGLFLSCVEYRAIYNAYRFCFYASCLDVFFLYLVIYNKNGFPRWQRNRISPKPCLYPNSQKIYLIHHRIRQC